ncbi:MAG: class I SAM-dependent rRNA methyltransferase [Candidatus Kapabacteria bacterium]|nr:class I SAM-dependent rRNA methyltransferase [Ignavibacteriota bacterium]MCW5885109.1 class I SAM-dependent rRNA methyltransferase [Candidatus Kapabacteria bacterium]
MEIINLKNGSERKIRTGYLWAFNNELVEVKHLTPGTVVELFNYNNSKSFGKCFYNPNSLITVRLLKTSGEINTNFFIERIRKAKNHRDFLLPNQSNYRLVFGESDLLSGLIIDKYENNFSLQIHSIGMELNRDMIVEALLNIYPETEFIIMRANSKMREIEGLSLEDEILFGKDPGKILTNDSNIKLEISLTESQKTGYFLDQRFHRYEIGRIAKGKRVLDCYTNQGGFALHSKAGGASEVTAIDSSQEALNFAERNAEINSLDINFVRDDVKFFLENAAVNKQRWDIIILDPPAFSKTKKAVGAAKNAYIAINTLGIRLLKPGGMLATASCSQHLREDTFMEIIQNSARKAGRNLTQIYRGFQPPDHPVHISMPETSYLKFFIFKIDY